MRISEEIFVAGVRYSSPAIISLDFIVAGQLIWLYFLSRTYQRTGQVIFLVLVSAMYAYGLWYFI